MYNNDQIKQVEVNEESAKSNVKGTADKSYDQREDFYLEKFRYGDYGLFECKICRGDDLKPVHVECFNMKDFRPIFQDYCIESQSSIAVMLVGPEIRRLSSNYCGDNDIRPSLSRGDLERYRRVALRSCGVCAFTYQLPLDIVKCCEAAEISHPVFMIDDDIEFFHEGDSTIGYYPFMMVNGMGFIDGYIREDVNPNVITSEKWRQGSRIYVDLNAAASKVAFDPIATYDRTICVRDCHAGLDLAIANLVDMVFGSKYNHHIEIKVSHVWWDEPKAAFVLRHQDYDMIREIDNYRDLRSFESTSWRNNVEVCFPGNNNKLNHICNCM